MKIISWNVNGIRAVERKWEIQNLIEKYNPDILFLQEIKWTSDKFSNYLNNPENYDVFYNSAQKAWYSGTGIWIKKEFKKFVTNIITSFDGNPNEDEWRVIHLELTKDEQIFDIFGIYFPNGWKSPEAWDGKLVFYENFSKKINFLRNLGHIVIWGWDINCAHNPIDLARPKENDWKIGFHPSERKWLDSLNENNWYDIWRVKNPDIVQYSWWDVKTRSRETNVWWRIDGIWGEKKAFDKTKNIVYLDQQMGSDHCPMMIEIDF